jgi:hypothetical protein
MEAKERSGSDINHRIERRTMRVFDKQSIGDLLLLDVLADLHRVKRKLAYFAGKYGMDLERFETQVNAQSESFERYDDLIEWKGFQAAYREAVERIEELKHGRFQVA